MCMYRGEFQTDPSLVDEDDESFLFRVFSTLLSLHHNFDDISSLIMITLKEILVYVRQQIKMFRSERANLFWIPVTVAAFLFNRQNNI